MIDNRYNKQYNIVNYFFFIHSIVNSTLGFAYIVLLTSSTFSGLENRLMRIKSKTSFS